MTKKTSSLLSALILFTVAYAQSGDYYNLKDVRQYRFDRLELSTASDQEKYIARADELNFIEALKINGTGPLDALLKNNRNSRYIRELNLRDYSGDLAAGSLDSCTGVEILHLSLAEDKLDRLRCLSSLGSLTTVYLYIQGKPEDLKPLSYLPVLRELHIIGEFLPAQLGEITNHIAEQTFMQVLGLSVDRITDLPQSVCRFKTLSSLILYDNQSVAANKGIEELNEEKLSIMFDLYTDAINAISVSYFSLNNKLADFETDYLQKLYKGEILPGLFAEEAAETSGGTIPFDAEFVPDFRPGPEFSNPYPLISPASELFTVNPAIANVLYSSSGMKITIAPNSFVNAEGIVISEPVYIRLMQLSSAQDLLFAGLNLKNGDKQFCGKFMFNLQATASKSVAVLREGYQIKLNLPAAKDSAITYFYDYESGTWQDLAFYEQIFASVFVPTDFYKLESKGMHAAAYQFDTSGFNERFAGRHNYLLNDYKNQAQLLFKSGRFYTDLDRTWNREFNKDGRLKGIKIKKGKSYVKIQKVIPKTRNRSLQYFKVLDKTEQKVFAELSALKNINFSLPFNPENKKEFTENYIKDARYCDVRITYKTGKDYCDILFKTADGFKSLKAGICDTDNKEQRKKQIGRFAKAYRNYQKIRDRREAEFNALNQVRFEEFKTYSLDKIKNLQKDNNAFEMKIQQLGTFGLMYETTPIFNSNIIAQYTDEKGLPVDVKDLFLIDSRYNTVFRKEVGNIQFDPLNCFLIVATDYSGNLYYANKTDVAAAGLSDNSLTYIRLKKAGRGISSIPMFNQLIRN